MTSARPVMRTMRDRAAVAAVVVAGIGIVAFLPDGLLRWTFPKYLVVALAVWVALFARRRGHLPRWAWAVAGAAFVTLVVAAVVGSATVGTDVWAGLIGRWPRYLGPAMALPIGVGAAWLAASLLGPRADPVVVRAFLITLSAISAAVALVSALEAAGARPLSSDLQRPGSLFGNATDQGIVCAMLLVVLVGAAVQGRVRLDPVLRLVVPAGAASALLGLGLSASRGAYVAVVFGLAIVAVLTWRTGVVRGRTVGLAAAAVSIVLAAVVLLIPGSVARVTGADPVAAATVGERWTLWQWGLQVWGTSPLIGAGSGSFIDRVPRFQDAAWFLDRPLNTVLESSHNWILDAAADGGIVLVLVMAVALALVVRAAARRIRSVEHEDVLFSGAVAACVVAFVALLAHPTGPAVFLLVSLLVGVVVAEPASIERGRESRVRTVVLRCATGVVVIVLALGTVAEFPMAPRRDRSIAPDEGFAAAAALRPWDKEVVALGAQTLTASVAAGDDGARGRAQEWTARAVALFPHTLAVLDARAVTLEAEEDWSGAAAVRQAMSVVAPHDIPARQDLAVDLAMAGDLERALEVAAAVLDERPDFENARKLMQQICEIRFSEECSALQE